MIIVTATNISGEGIAGRHVDMDAVLARIHANHEIAALVADTSYGCLDPNLNVEMPRKQLDQGVGYPGCTALHMRAFAKEINDADAVGELSQQRIWFRRKLADPRETKQTTVVFRWWVDIRSA